MLARERDGRERAEVLCNAPQPDLPVPAPRREQVRVRQRCERRDPPRGLERPLGLRVRDVDAVREGMAEDGFLLCCRPERDGAARPRGPKLCVYTRGAQGRSSVVGTSGQDSQSDWGVQTRLTLNRPQRESADRRSWPSHRRTLRQSACLSLLSHPALASASCAPHRCRPPRDPPRRSRLRARA